MAGACYYASAVWRILWRALVVTTFVYMRLTILVRVLVGFGESIAVCLLRWMHFTFHLPHAHELSFFGRDRLRSAKSCLYTLGLMSTTVIACHLMV